MRNKFICGDSLHELKRIPDKYVDLTVTSPPYDNLRTYNGFEWDFEGIAKELYRVTKDGGVVVWVVGDATINGSETGTSFRQALYFKEIGFNLHDTMIYEKENPIPLTHNRYEQKFEYMFIFSKGRPNTFNPIMRENSTAGTKQSGTFRHDGNILTQRNSDRKTKKKSYRYNIWKYPVGRGSTTNDLYAFKHPAMFPEQLANDHIISWSNQGDVVLDPFGGGGTTAKMSVLNDRDFIYIDISDEYVEIAKRRVNEAIAKKAAER